jgi:hypothetical protein
LFINCCQKVLSDVDIDVTVLLLQKNQEKCKNWAHNLSGL